MRICDCGYPVVSCMAVAQNEWACFKCGKVFEYCGRDRAKDTPELETQYEQAMKIKKQFFKEYPFESEGDYTKSLSPSQFKEWFDENLVYNDPEVGNSVGGSK